MLLFMQVRRHNVAVPAHKLVFDVTMTPVARQQALALDEITECLNHLQAHMHSSTLLKVVVTIDKLDISHRLHNHDS